MAHEKSYDAKYMVDEENQKRLMHRISNNETLKHAQLAMQTFGDKDKKLQQRMYVQPVGRISEFHKLPNSQSYDDKIVEQHLEYTRLYQDEAKLLEKREEYAVIEDDFGPILEKRLKGGPQPSFDTLRSACEELDKSSDTHYKKDARAYAMAIAFYSGGYSALASTAANYVIRKERTMAELNTDDENLNSHALMVLHYLIKGLSHIDFYWGVVTRYVQLDTEDMQDYRPGEIVTWLQFSSADKGGKHMTYFNQRNTVFKIASLTGRAIQQFSNCGDEEDEVLFLPHSSFLVCHVIESQPQRQVFMRQVELGFAKHVILWVDDNIFDKKWGNKRLMEKAMTRGASLNVHFIPKSNTDSALAFLRSAFGQRIKDRNSFRIVTDMKREKEDNPSFAGIRFLNEVRKLGFKQSFLIFTGHEGPAYTKLKQELGTDRPAGVKVTALESELERFVLFDLNSTTTN